LAKVQSKRATAEPEAKRAAEATGILIFLSVEFSYFYFPFLLSCIVEGSAKVMRGVALRFIWLFLCINCAEIIAALI
jgi:hypothetical protein